jgi:hypothetical protein
MAQNVCFLRLDGIKHGLLFGYGVFVRQPSR